jgi:ADP-ribose pyrophosphatase YjhB (NUDIX family)
VAGYAHQPIKEFVMPTLLDQARRLLAVAHTGLHYTQVDFERERYQEIAQIAADLIASSEHYSAQQIHHVWRMEDGYVTPKLDVRGAMFRGNEVLLVRERMDGKWTVPGGFADVNEWPSLSVLKEIEQESGYTARVLKLAAVHDRNQHNYPPFMFHIWKLLFVCEITGGEARISNETDGVEFFSLDALPELSSGRITAPQLQLLHRHYLQPTLPTEFD